MNELQAGKRVPTLTSLDTKPSFHPPSFPPSRARHILSADCQQKDLALGATCAATYLDFLADMFSNGSNRLKQMQQTSSLSQGSKGESGISTSMPNLHLQNADLLVHPGCKEVQ